MAQSARDFPLAVEGALAHASFKSRGIKGNSPAAVDAFGDRPLKDADSGFAFPVLA
ncbi:hypothetical protein F11_05710 [Rhodospirillum rubrum F11]|nr:hypothetical protein F11_05710 [Rhodospirillum rubrum F11]